MIAEKNGKITDVDAQIGRLQKQREKYVAHYRSQITEQLKIKKPVDTELTDLLVEVKRMKKELSRVLHDIKILEKKIDLQRKRVEELGKTEKESNKYLSAEISSEIELNLRSQSLKEEKVELLRQNIESAIERSNKIRRVIKQYDDQIAELRSGQRDVLNRIKSKTQDLQRTKAKVEGQIKKIRGEMEPVLAELGGAVKTRHVEADQLTEEYSTLERLEKDREIIRKEITRHKKDSGSIGLGIKFGYYALLIAVLALLALLIITLG
jgi:DNA repair exonuclease SbcCD ATPase subunit